MGDGRESKGRKGRRARKALRAVKRWVRRLIVLAVLVAVGLFALRAYLRAQAGDATEAETYSRASVVRGPMSETVYGTGTTSARSQPNIFAEADGTLTELRVNVGDEVKQGDVLAVLANDELDDSIADLEFQLWDLDDTIAGTSAGSTPRYIVAPVAGRLMAVYAAAGDDALAVFRREGALAIISTDGRMRVDLTDLPAASGVEMGDKVRVIGLDSGFEAEGTVTDVTRQGTQISVTVIDDTLPMDARVSVCDGAGREIGQGTLAVNKPMAVSSYGGTIDAVSANVGDKVARNDALFRLEDSPLTLKIENLRIQRETAAKDLAEAKEQRENLIVLAPCDGVVASLDVSEGDEITAGTLIGSILEGEDMNLTIAVDELDVVDVAPGQSVVITVDALGDAQLPGTVAKISPVGANSGGVTTYDVELTLDATGSGVRSGMNATGEITVASTDSTLYVPVEALMTVGDQTYVMLEDGGAQPAASEWRASGRMGADRSDAVQTGAGRMGAGRMSAEQTPAAQTEAAPADAAEEGATGASRIMAGLRGAYDALLSWLYDGALPGDVQQQPTGTLTPVEVGMQNDDYAEILSGVSEGDVVLYASEETSNASGFGMGGGMSFGLGGMGGGNPGGNRGGMNR